MSDEMTGAKEAMIRELCADDRYSDEFVGNVVRSWVDVTCHCGELVAYGFDGNPFHHRSLCERCDAVRCDAYPGACNV